MNTQEKIKALKERIAEKGYSEEEHKFIDWYLEEFGEGSFYELDKYYGVEETIETDGEEHVKKFPFGVGITMNDKQKLIMMFMSIQGKIANTYDNVDMDSEVEELLEHIVAKLDEGAGIVSSMKLLEE